jgi:acetyltransferase-like isoleucine patch superfamily enzyme
MADRVRRARLYYRKWKWFERGSLPWRRAALTKELMRRESYARWPLEGNVLESLRLGKLELGRNVHFEPHVWISVLTNGHLKLGEGVAINQGVFISVFDSVEIGDHTGVGNGSFISDGMRGFHGPPTPFMRQPMWSKGPVRIGSNVWVGVNCIITSGVTIGDWCIIGANSVVTHDIPSGSIAVGAPARVIRELDFKDVLGDGDPRRVASLGLDQGDDATPLLG